MNVKEAFDKIQKTRRFQVLTFLGLILTYPIALVPILFSVLLGVDADTFEVMLK